jgi:PPOX class probable F420-dependent enzyme
MSQVAPVGRQGGVTPDDGAEEHPMTRTDDDLRTRTHALRRFAGERQILLTTYRRDGTPVGTPVHVAVEGDAAYVRTFDPSGKLKRIRNNPDVDIAPSTLRGRATGPSSRARARILEGDESVHAAQLLAAKYPLLHGHLIPWYHRRKGLVTTQIELTPR